MKLITFCTADDDHRRLGALTGDGHTAVDLTAASGGKAAFASMLALIRSGPEALDEARRLVAAGLSRTVVDLAAITLEAPLPDPVRLRDCSLFIEHLQPALRGVARAVASDAEDPDAEYARLIATGRFDMPEVFSREVVYYNADHTAISGPDEVIVAPRETRRLDYELEFAAVIGLGGRDLTPTFGDGTIFGYTMFNDWSCRDLQAAAMESQLGPSRGKDFDRSNTLGPYIVTADEVDPYGMELTASVNGEVWSRGNSSTMHHTFEAAISHFSRERTMYPGEVYGTGTVLSGSPIEIGRALADGDVVEIEADALGILRNIVDLGY